MRERKDNMKETTREDFINGLIELAEFYRERPELELPYRAELNIFARKAEDLPRIAKLFGTCKKEVLGDSYFVLSRKFGLLTLEALWGREQVCERVVVGQETVEEEVPVVYEKRTVTRDRIRWDCPKGVLAPETPKVDAGTPTPLPESVSDATGHSGDD
jgi:hypothetical protein